MLSGIKTYAWIQRKESGKSVVAGAGWAIIATSTSLKIPFSNKIHLPAPPSSAGVPITVS